MADSSKPKGMPFNALVAQYSEYPITVKDVPKFSPPTINPDGSINETRWYQTESGEVLPLAPYKKSGITIEVPVSAMYSKIDFERMALRALYRNPFISEPVIEPIHNVVTPEIWLHVLDLARNNREVLDKTVFKTLKKNKDGSPRGWEAILTTFMQKSGGSLTPVAASIINEGLGALPEVVAAYKAELAAAGRTGDGTSKYYTMRFHITDLTIVFNLGSRYGDTINYIGSMSRESCPSVSVFEQNVRLLMVLFAKDNISLLTSLSPDQIKMKHFGGLTYKGVAGDVTVEFPLNPDHGIEPEMVTSYWIESSVSGSSIAWFSEGKTEAKFKNVPMLHGRFLPGMNDNLDIVTLIQYAMADNPTATYSTTEHSISLKGMGFMSLYQLSYTLVDQSNKTANPNGITVSPNSMRVDDFVILQPPEIIERPRYTTPSTPITKDSKVQALDDLESAFC